MVDIALATSAAPTYLPPHVSQGYTFVDGGLYANNPVMIGVVDALTNYRIRRDQVRVLSILTASDKRPITSGQRRLGGLISWRKAVLHSIDLQSQNSSGQAALLVGPENLQKLFPEGIQQEIAMDDFRRAVQLLPQEARSSFDQHREKIIRTFLKGEKVGCKFHYGSRAAV